MNENEPERRLRAQVNIGIPESKATQQRTHSKTLRVVESPGEIRQVLECVRCCAALVPSRLEPGFRIRT